jgi:ketosteroid isomerase-like protein
VPSGNLEVVDRFTKAFGEGDTDAALACLDPEVELRPIRAQLEGHTYRGHQGYLDTLALFDQDWEDLRIVPQHLRERDPYVAGAAKVTARGRASGIDLDVRVGVLFEVRNGRIVRLESFNETEEALRAAGIDA